MPVGLYWMVNFIEGNFVSPNLMGRTMTVNPFLVFLSLTFWLWAWGPVGGLIAVPSLLMLYSVVTNILPLNNVTPRRIRRKLQAKATADVRVAAIAETEAVARASAEDRSDAATVPVAAG